MESASPTKEVEKVVSTESNLRDVENECKSSTPASTCESNVKIVKSEDLPSQSVENVTNIGEDVNKAEVSNEELTQIPTKSAADSLGTKNNVPESKDESVNNDSIEMQHDTAASAESKISEVKAEPDLQKADELQKTTLPVKSETHPDANVSKDIVMEEPQKTTVATVASESISQVSQETQQPSQSVGESNESVTQGAANVAAETINISDSPPEAQKERGASRAATSIESSGLSMLAAQYDSGSDSDVCEVTPAQTYQNRVVEINSDTESSSSSSSDDEEDNQPIDVELLNAVHVDDDEEENVRTSRSPRVKGEFHLDDLPPIHELKITVPEDECTELGKIQSIVEQLVIVNSLPGTVPLDLDTVLFLDKGKKVLGEIFDVLGQVADPLYCIRFNSNQEIKSKGIEVGQTVYVAPRTEHTQFVILGNLMKMRGSDASWENDVEPPERYLDYSDDEEERSARRTVRNKNRLMEVGDEAPKRYRPADANIPPGSRHHPGQYYDGMRPPHYPLPNSYNIAGSSWHSNYPQNYNNVQQQYPQYRQPRHYRPPPRGMPHRQPIPHPGLVVNPYAVYPPPHIMQQPLFPPPTHQPPPPPPGPHGGY